MKNSIKKIVGLPLAPEPRMDILVQNKARAGSSHGVIQFFLVLDDFQSQARCLAGWKVVSHLNQKILSRFERFLGTIGTPNNPFVL